jgi:hypothetical protein
MGISGLHDGGEVMLARVARLLLATAISEIGGALIGAARDRITRRLERPKGASDDIPTATKKAPEAPVQ